MGHPLPDNATRTLEAIITQAIRDRTNTLSIRRACCLALGLHGLRLQEVINIKRQDLDASRRLLRVHTIKRGRKRVIELDPLLTRTLIAINSGGARNAPLITGPRKKGPLMPVTIWMYAKWMARVLRTPCTFHCLRHTAAHRVYARTHDVYAVHKMLGHSTLHQTHIYLQTSMPTRIELGPTFGGWLGTPELVAYTGPMDDETRALSLRAKLIEGRLPPARGGHRHDKQRIKDENDSAYIREKLGRMEALERERVIRQIIMHQWPRPADPTKQRHDTAKT